MDISIKKNLDFHADDYGISKNSCNDIINLLSKGYLNSISVLPNMQTFDYAVESYKNFQAENPDKKIEVTVHLNFMEGHCCANPKELPDLVDSKGYFKISWGSLFKFNYIPLKRKSVKNQLKKEILSQTNKHI